MLFIWVCAGACVRGDGRVDNCSEKPALPMRCGYGSMGAGLGQIHPTLHKTKLRGYTRRNSRSTQLVLVLADGCVDQRGVV